MKSPVEYEQTDPRWRSVPYTVRPGSGETIGNNGCGPTCAAMVAATLRDKSITPVQAAAWSVEHGYCSAYDGTYWSFFAAYFRSLGISCEQTGYAATALEAIRAGKMVIVSMGRSIWTTAGHFVLCYGMQNGKILIHDPNSEQTNRELATEANFRIGFRQAWIVGEQQEEDDDMKYYKSLKEVPAWAREIISRMIELHIIRGTGTDLNLSEDMVRMFVYLDRLGLLPKQAKDIK